MTGFGITTIPIGVYFDKAARKIQKCIMRYFGKTDFLRWSMLHRQEGVIKGMRTLRLKGSRAQEGDRLWWVLSGGRAEMQ